MPTVYIDRTKPDASGITLLCESESPEPSPTASPHCHSFFEVTLVVRGSCKVFTSRHHILLIPGDLLLFPPDRLHACLPQKGAQICSCQFESHLIPRTLMQNTGYWDMPQASAAHKRLHDLQAFASSEVPLLKRRALSDSDAPNPPDIMHLARAEFTRLHEILQNIASEQEERCCGFEEMKRLRLQELLILIRRIQLSQLQPAGEQTSWKEDMVGEVLTQIDQNLAQGIDFEAIAHSKGVTLSYFRAIFKEITGMSPTDYLGRIRILRALELLQTCDAPVSEIGRKVGICDANYFSRLFKKVTGYPPRYFKAIPERPDEPQSE